MKKLLVTALLLAATNHTALTASDTSCRRLVDMLVEYPDLQTTFATTQEYLQCADQKDALDVLTRSPKPEHALVVTQQLIQDGHKAVAQHVEQCMDAYWSGRYQAGNITSSWASTADKQGLLRARTWTNYAQHYLALARLLTATSTETHNMTRFKQIHFDCIENDRAQEARLIEQVLQNLDE